MREHRLLRLLALLLVGAGLSLAQERTVPITLDRNWRPAASKLLETAIGNRYETDDILTLFPQDFDMGQLEKLRTMALTNRFKDVNEEFECKYTLFRYALSRWATSTDDAHIDREFKRRYISFQDLCRRLYRRHAFANAEQERKAEWVKDPYDVYSYFLYVYLDELALQLDTRENPTGATTLAEDYLKYPSETNQKQLQQLFFSINRNFESRNYTWSRYINKYKFQVARKTLFAGEWQRDMDIYHHLLSRKGDSRGYREALEEARRSAQFSYERLKKESDTNCLPYFSKVNAFYLSDTVDDYPVRVAEEEQLEKARAQAGRKGEVVVFIHGLGENRRCWGEFPELLAREDVADPTLKKHYHVYVFQYATEEKSKGVDDFVEELAGFIEETREKESVEKVTLIGHSFGGVISLRYLTTKDPKTGRPHRDKVSRFIGIAPSLHGSQMANLVVDVFGKKERKFERDLPLFGGGMPFVGKMGDLQIVQNQVGSGVNLASFGTLDRDKCLDPPGADRIATLIIAGDPWFPTDLFSPGGRTENDGLVKTFSANLNHVFLEGGSAEKNIGYSGAEIRYTDLKHFPIIKAMDRRHIAYRYVTSFLKGALLPQESPQQHQVEYFLAAVRVFPAGVPDPKQFFLPREQRLPTGAVLLPGLTVKPAAVGSARLHSKEWNPATGVYFVEGHIEPPAREGVVAVALSAEGYTPKELRLPVKAGQVTYAVNVVLER